MTSGRNLKKKKKKKRKEKKKEIENISMASVFGEMIVKKRLGASDLKKVENFLGLACKLVF